MKIAYFVNKYPAVSHSFIRREILELERQGMAVERYAIYCEADTLQDPLDKQEYERTRYIKSQSPFTLVAIILGIIFSHPTSFLRALIVALTEGRRGDSGIIKQFLYLLEGCVLARWCRDASVEHVHAHFGTNPAAIARYAWMITGIGYSFTVHGPDEFDHPQGLLLREKIRDARFVNAISSYGRSQLMRWSDYRDWARIRVVHCGLDQAFLHDSPDSGTTKPTRGLVCVGRLSAQKGQLLLIEAMARLRERGLEPELILAGDGEMRGEVEALIRQHGLTGQVRITGWIDSATVRDLLEKSSAMVLPSFAEGLPVVIMEAFACRRPVLTTYVAGIPELVQDGINGFLFPAGSVDAIADAIERLLALSPDEQSRMGEAGRTAVLERHDIRTEMQKMRQQFEEVIRD